MARLSPAIAPFLRTSRLRPSSRGSRALLKRLPMTLPVEKLALRSGTRRWRISATAHSAEDASREADLIIETVSDEMEMKIELFTIFDKFAKPGVIFASTTASLSITDLAAITFCPEHCIGMRFTFDPRSASRLELVTGLKTSAETVAACREVGRCMGREVSVLSDEQVASASAGL